LTTIKIEYDSDNEEYILPLGFDLCDELGWTIGDNLLWIDNKDGTFTLKKKDEEK